MFGNNPIRPPVMNDGSSLDVQEVFPTFQGEGPHTGVPAVFIRLGGCNLACSFCDTEFESFTSTPLPALLENVKALACNDIQQRVKHLVVITGGEPFRQNITPLCEALVAEGFTVQIESNGTLYRALPEGVQIVCSPKNTGTGYHAVRPDVLRHTIALKYIISVSREGYTDVPDIGGTTPIYVQPMDEYDAAKNAANLARAKTLVLQRGYRLSLQTHKIAGVP